MAPSKPASGKTAPAKSAPATVAPAKASPAQVEPQKTEPEQAAPAAPASGPSTPAPATDLPAEAAPAEVPAEPFAFDADQPQLGQWTGVLHTTADPKSFFVLRIEADKNGAPVGEVLDVYGRSATNTLTVENGKVGVTAPFGPLELSFDGEISADGQTLSGQGSLISKDQPGAPFPVELKREPRVTALAGVRGWSGTLTIEGKGDVPFSLLLGSTPAGRLVAEVDIPALKLQQAPLVGVHRTQQQLQATWPANQPVVLDLAFGENDRTLEGSAQLTGHSNSVKLALDDSVLAHRGMPVPRTVSQPK